MVDVLIDVLAEMQVQDQHTATMERHKRLKALIDLVLAAQDELGGADWPKKLNLSEKGLESIKGNMENYLRVQKQLNRERQAILEVTEVGEEDRNFMERWLRDAEAVVGVERILKCDAMKNVVAKKRAPKAEKKK